MSEQRIPLDEMTSDQLDTLYARIDTLEAVCLSNKRAYAGAVQAAWTAEAERDRYRTAWQSARIRVKRAKRNRDSELRWANGMWSDALRDLGRYRTAWKSARHRAAMYLQSNQNFAASLENNHAAYLQMAAEITRLTAGQCTHHVGMCTQHHAVPVDGCPYPKCKAARTA